MKKMKKVFLCFAFLGLLSFATPAKVSAQNEEPCYTVTIHCADGSGAICIVCSMADLQFFKSYYCDKCND